MAEVKKIKPPAKSKLKHQKGPTDAEYRARWKIFEFADGTFYDSREIYWRNIPNWEQVVKITVYIRDHVHVFDNPHDGFFMLSHQYLNVDKRNYTEWCCGYLKDGIAHLTDIDFKTGELRRNYTEPLEVMKNHLHIKLKNKLKIK